MDGKTYDATITNVEKHRIFVVIFVGEWILNNEWNSRILTNDESEQKQENETLKQLYETGANDEIINELVNIGIGSRNECIAASLLVVNPNDINEITNKVSELQNVCYKNYIFWELIVRTFTAFASGSWELSL